MKCGTLCPCGAERRPGQGYCRACHSAHMRAWRSNQPATLQDKVKRKCQKFAEFHLRAGLIEREGCRVCGAPAQMHHGDYTQPLKIVWLCRQHFRELDKLPAPG